MRMAWQAAAAVLALGALLSARPVGPADPLVALDAAKVKLAQGRLTEASEMLALVPPPSADEEYIAEEVLLQQILIDSALLSATHYLSAEMKTQKLGESNYAQWLAGERKLHAQSFARHAADYLARTANGAALDFVRFDLPTVSLEHVKDATLYSDPALLSAATTNWDDGREGLGKGLVAAQARVALVLAAAVNCDLPQASSSLEAVAARLHSGVPLQQRVLLEWLMTTARQIAQSGDPLASIADQAAARLKALGGPLSRADAPGGEPAGTAGHKTNHAGQAASEKP